MKSVSDEQQMVMNLNKEISTMKSVLNDNQKSITEVWIGSFFIHKNIVIY
jgi:hypothetical protein